MFGRHGMEEKLEGVTKGAQSISEQIQEWTMGLSQRPLWGSALATLARSRDKWGGFCTSPRSGHLRRGQEVLRISFQTSRRQHEEKRWQPTDSSSQKQQLNSRHKTLYTFPRAWSSDFEGHLSLVPSLRGCPPCLLHQCLVHGKHWSIAGLPGLVLTVAAVALRPAEEETGAAWPVKALTRWH